MLFSIPLKEQISIKLNFYLLSMPLSIPASLLPKIDLHIPKVTTITNIDLMAAIVAKVVKQYGASHARAQQAFGVFDRFCKKEADLRCHCVPKHPHYCAIG